MLVAIHQPNFLPNPAFFSKMLACDHFIYLDTAQFPTEGWVHRNKLLAGGEAAWVTIPVLTQGRGAQRIADAEVRNTTPWRKKLLRRIEQEYAHAPYLKQFLPPVEAVLAGKQTRLAELALEMLQVLREMIGITVPVSIASNVDQERGNLSTPDGDASERLLWLVKAVGGTAYLSGPTGRKYVSEEAFASAGIGLRFNAWTPAPYPQPCKTFVPGLSILDMLLCVGREETLSRLKLGKANEGEHESQTRNP